MNLSVIIASGGRATLAQTLDSIQPQLRQGDETLVSINSHGDWGHHARNQLMQAAEGDYLLFIDDDDVYLPGALDVVREAVATDTKPSLHIFKMRYADGGIELWRTPEIFFGNVSTQMAVVPNITKIRKCRWADVYEGDFHFITAAAKRVPTVWHEDVIALIRPHSACHP